LLATQGRQVAPISLFRVSVTVTLAGLPDGRAPATTRLPLAAARAHMKEVSSIVEKAPPANAMISESRSRGKGMWWPPATSDACRLGRIPDPTEGHPTVGLKKLRARGGEPGGAEEHPGAMDDGRSLPSAAAPNAIAGAPPGFSRRRMRASSTETRGRPSSRFGPEGTASHHGAWRHAGEPSAATQAVGEVQPAWCYLCRLGDLHWAPPRPRALAHNALHRL
jgi:hypothetical protein